MIIKYTVYEPGTITVQIENEKEKEIADSQPFSQFVNSLFLKYQDKFVNEMTLNSIKQETVKYLLDVWAYSGKVEILREP